MIIIFSKLESIFLSKDCEYFISLFYFSIDFNMIIKDGVEESSLIPLCYPNVECDESSPS